MTGNEIGEELQRFKSRMLIEFPFYGDILLRIPIFRDDSVPTACTDGRTIRWSADFMGKLSPPERRYVLMHEVFHTLLRHPSRTQGRDFKVWNVATDIIVNNYCDRLAAGMKKPGLELKRPARGIFRATDQLETAENLYGRILADNPKKQRQPGSLNLRKTYQAKSVFRNGKLVPVPSELERVQLGEGDLIPGGPGGVPLTPEEQQALEEAIKGILREAGTHGRGTEGSFFIPRELLRLTESRMLDWRAILKEFLNEIQSDETSYATPERKYLHMDIILPGHGLSEEGELESVWAFVDSSGSVSHADLQEFLTQLYRIVKDFHCEMNIAYWDTSVTDVYEKLRRENQIVAAQPKHSGGTDINCVYRYVRERKLKPLVSLILTDGYFGRPDPALCKELPAKNTILLLCNNSNNPVYQTVGRVCRLKPEP